MEATPYLQDQLQATTAPNTIWPLASFNELLYGDPGVISADYGHPSWVSDPFGCPITPPVLDEYLARNRLSIDQSGEASQHKASEWSVGLSQPEDLQPSTSSVETVKAGHEWRREPIFKEQRASDAATSPGGSVLSPPRPESPLGELESLLRSPWHRALVSSTEKTPKKRSSPEDGSSKRKRETRRRSSASVSAKSELKTKASPPKATLPGNTLPREVGKDDHAMTSGAASAPTVLPSSALRSLLECASNPAYVLERIRGCDGNKGHSAAEPSAFEWSCGPSTNDGVETACSDEAPRTNATGSSMESQEPEDLSNFGWTLGPSKGHNSPNMTWSAERPYGQIDLDAIHQLLMSDCSSGEEGQASLTGTASEQLTPWETTPSMTEESRVNTVSTARTEAEQGSRGEGLLTDLVSSLASAGLPDRESAKSVGRTSPQSPGWTVLNTLLERQLRPEAGTVPRKPMEGTCEDDGSIDGDGTDKDKLEVVARALDAAKSLLETVAVQMHLKGVTA